MASYCHVTILGNLTRDPELRVLNTGKAVCQFGVAINRKFKGKDGEAREEVSFIDCTAWEKTAELIQKYYTKGKPILLNGTIKQENWEDKTSGQKRSKLTITVSDIVFLPRNSDDQSNDGAGDAPPFERTVHREKPDARPTQPNLDIDDLDSVPF